MADAHSSIPDVSPEAIETAIEEAEYTGRKLGPRTSILIGMIAALWSIYQLWIASPLPYRFGFGIIFGVQARGIHLAFGLLLCFLLFPAVRRLATRQIPIYDIFLALLGMACALYVFLGHEGLVDRQGILLAFDVSLFGIDFSFPFETILGGIGLLLLLEATRRSIGLPLVIVACVFLIYSIFGQSMPDIISHKGVSLTRLIGYDWLGGEAIFGIPIDVSTSFVFLFVLFGAMLDKAGAGKYFLDLAFAMVGKYRGGPAKAAILASGMTGAISGSSIANVVTTGTFTIPVMKRMGMPAVKAGAIEVAASTNGQLMPPIMGAAAFIIAEFVGISYFDVIIAAAVPAVISYLALFYISHLEAMKLGLRGMPKSEIPPLGKIFVGGIHFLLPIVALIYLLMVERWTASSAVLSSIILMMFVILSQRAMPRGLSRSVANIPYTLPIIAFAVLRTLGGFDASEALFWVYVVALLVVAGEAWLKGRQEAAVWEDIRLALGDIYGGLVAGARNMINISVAVAAAGIIVGAVSATGLSNAMIGVVEAISGGNIYILLGLTAVLCLILGMGLPTTANYIVVASLMAGVVVELSTAAGLVIPLISIHLFVFYFGILADDTPPVCLAAFAAAAISRADPIKTGIQGFTYDIRTAILPFVFIFNPELLLIGVESFWHGLLVISMSLIAILSFAALTQGWMIVRLRLYEMAMLAVVILALFRPGFIMDRFYPEFVSLDLDEFVAGEAAGRPGYDVRFHVVRETNYGDRYKLYRIATPDMAATDPFVRYGIEIEPTDDDRYAVADLAVGGLAEQIGLELGDYVTDVDVEQAGLPPKQLVYPFALALLAVVIGLQLGRRRRERPTDALATGTAE
ncbi:MAG: TRAP transporter permease [Proteobacteria bacterium]|nr:TRAP transporter permease [Pseudomonadota bacterium]